MSDEARDRFAQTAERLAALQDRRAPALAARVRRFVSPQGEERALDAGCGAGALAFALAPIVAEVVGVDRVPELLEQARARAVDVPNVRFIEGDIVELPFPPALFDLVGTLRTLHHVPRPELVVAELVRVTRPGGRLLVVDQIAPNDPLAALELNHFEQARDPTHTRALADVDMRLLFESNNLVLLRSERVPEERELGPYLDLAACEGEERARAESLAPARFTVDIGWYLLKKPSLF
jgi:SAM-dependent methyltransferase